MVGTAVVDITKKTYSIEHSESGLIWHVWCSPYRCGSWVRVQTGSRGSGGSHLAFVPEVIHAGFVGEGIHASPSDT